LIWLFKNDFESKQQGQKFQGNDSFLGLRTKHQIAIDGTFSFFLFLFRKEIKVKATL